MIPRCGHRLGKRLCWVWSDWRPGLTRKRDPGATYIKRYFCRNAEGDVFVIKRIVNVLILCKAIRQYATWVISWDSQM